MGVMFGKVEGSMPHFLTLPGMRRWRWKLRLRLLAAAALTCTVLVLYAFPLEMPHVPVPWGQTARSIPPLTVLIWWEPFGRRRRLGDCQLLFNISSCHVTTNRTAQNVAHAVLFHHRDLGDASQLPHAGRPNFQRWVWMNFESPSHSHWLDDLGGVFNWTMSYNTDSDVFLPYGYLYPQEVPKIRLPRKNKLLAWVISNWNEDHARVQYYNSLRRYVRIDVYGSYGLPLKDDNIVRTVSEYKFYLAFENSQHTDYITEKLWRNALKSNAVPVVLGPSRANYEMFIPRDSFIHVDDFSSPRKLATYLKFLDRNSHLYRKYFAWKKQYDVHVTSFWDEHYCTVCEAIRAAGDQSRSKADLARWYDS